MMKMVLLCRSETLANERKEREVLHLQREEEDAGKVCF
jgi:hypothetical protein